MQESRLFKIIYYLIEKGSATAPELSEKFEVSVRTIYRDIDVLSSAGIPIYTVQGKGGGIFLLEDFVLDRLLFSEPEREHILMGLQGILAAGGITNDELLTKLGALFQIKVTSWIEVDFSDWKQNPLDQNIFDTIKIAILTKKLLTFQYFGSDGSLSDRQVQPYKLVFKSKNWYLYGFCLKRHDFRFFKLTRIKKLTMASDSFSPDPLSPVIERKIPDEKTVSVQLKFDRRAAFRIYDEFAGNITEDDKGFLYVVTDLPDNDMLYSYLLSYADNVEIIAPQSIRDMMKEKITKIQEKYRT